MNAHQRRIMRRGMYPVSIYPPVDIQEPDCFVPFPVQTYPQNQIGQQKRHLFGAVWDIALPWAAALAFVALYAIVEHFR
jgi:hypothetical protein